ncbi:TonB-dependent receptor [Agarilytica rhodophyticola]|uniref:TonB-dependent receptor n=1 Tax=Agarilytica rhodophyticola TaxID=1737490 RepID=UPI000B344DAF|nr:TonB-dependent receptor [Agarilytica rhodophyticola]
MYNKNKILTLCVSCMTFSAAISDAQENKYAREEVEEMIIRGPIEGSLKSASQIKKNGSGVLDAISSEELGKFPDANVAESLQRITGVAITRSRGGEGQFVTVRGLGEEFNSVTFNNRVLATESGGREFSFDVVASELVSEAQIYKTSQAALTDGSIGGLVNIKTAKPFDKIGLRMAGSISGIYDDLADDTGLKVSGIISNTFGENDDWGILASFSHSDRNVRTDVVEGVNFFNINVDANNQADDPNDNIPLVHNNARYSSMTVLNSTEERTRTGGTLTLQVQPSENSELTFDILYSAFESPSESAGVSFFPGNPMQLRPGSISVNDNNFVESFEAEVQVDLLSRSTDNDTQTIQYGINGILDINDQLKLEGDIAYSKADGVRNNTGPATNSGSFYVIQIPNAIASTHAQPFAVPDFQFTGPNPNFDPVNGGDILAPENQEPLDQLLPSQLSTHFARNDSNNIKDEVLSLKLSGEYVFQDEIALKFGVDYTNRQKDTLVFNNLNPSTDCPVSLCSSARTLQSIDPNFSATNLNLGDFLSDTSANLPRNFPVISTSEVERIYQLFASQNNMANPLTSRLQLANSNSIEEYIIGGFVQLDLAGEIAQKTWRSNAGLRLVETNLDSSGHINDILSITGTGQGNQEFAFSDDIPITLSHNYFKVLPSFNLAIDISDKFIIRSAFSKTISRPTISDLSTAITVTRKNEFTEATSSGRPQLDPPESNNVDLSIEWYGESASASAAIFYKELSNFIANVSTVEPRPIQYFDDSDGDSSTAPIDQGIRTINFTNSRPTNGDSAEITGLELAYQVIFESNFGFLTNVTLTDSRATVVGVSNSFENISDLSYNLSAFYENEIWQARISFNHRSDYVRTTIGLQGLTQIVDDYSQVDASLSYSPIDQLTFFLEGINLTGEDYFEYSEIPEALVTYEDNEPRITFGLRASF